MIISVDLLGTDKTEVEKSNEFYALLVIQKEALSISRPVMKGYVHARIRKPQKSFKVMD